MIDVFDDYTINVNKIISSMDLPGWIFRILSAVISIAANTGLVILLFAIIPGIPINELTLRIAGAMGVSIFILGIIGGAMWELIARSFYAAYLPELKNNTISKVYRRFIDSDNNIFLEARSKDH